MGRLQSWQKATWETLEFRESKITLWHSVLFTLNIGVPVFAGWLGSSVRLGLVGAVLGLLLSLCDSTENIGHRLWLLLRAAAMILLFGTIGARLGAFHPLFWISFISLTFIAAWTSLTGRTLATAFRYAALALLSAASSPNLGTPAVGILGVAVVTSALTRVVGNRFFPDATLVLAPPTRRERPEFLRSVRFCTIYSGAVALGLTLGELLGAHRPLWIATTVLLVMQPDPQMSYARIVQRIFGTGIGVVAATLVVHTVHSEALLALVVLAIAFAFPHGSARNYWLHSAFAAWLVLVLMDFALAGKPFDTQLLTERMRDVIIGCAIALVGTVVSLQTPKKVADSPAST